MLSCQKIKTFLHKHPEIQISVFSLEIRSGDSGFKATEEQWGTVPIPDSLISLVLPVPPDPLHSLVLTPELDEL